jgi:hypothetical protein
MAQVRFRHARFAQQTPAGAIAGVLLVVLAGDLRLAGDQAPERDPGGQQRGLGDRRGEARGDEGLQPGAGQGRRGGHGGIERAGHHGIHMGIGFGDQRVDPGEIVADQARRNARFLRDRPHAGAIGAGAGQHAHGRLDQALPPGVGFGAARQCVGSGLGSAFGPGVGSLHLALPNDCCTIVQ